MHVVRRDKIHFHAMHARTLPRVGTFEKCFHLPQPARDFEKLHDRCTLCTPRFGTSKNYLDAMHVLHADDGDLKETYLDARCTHAAGRDLEKLLWMHVVHADDGDLKKKKISSCAGGSGLGKKKNFFFSSMHVVHAAGQD